MWQRITIIGILATAALYVTKRYFAGAVCHCRGRLDCRAVVITGATSGLGKALAFEVASRGAQVVLGCRDLAAAKIVCAEVSAATGNPSVYALHLDLASLASVREFARCLQKCEYEVHALVNNAGVFYHEQQDTQDGFDTTFQVNYLGGFLLTGLLLGLLQAGAPSRVINVSSQAHRLPKDLSLLLSDPVTPNASLTKKLSLFELYGQTKLCINLFSRKLASILKSQGISVVSVDPGNVETRIYRKFPPLCHPVLRAIQFPVRLVVVKTPREGAQSLLHAVLCPHLDQQSGAFIRECQESQPSKLSLSDELADLLWQRSLAWSQLTEEDFAAPPSTLGQ